MALTVTTINAAKSTDKPYKLADGLGLYLLVAPTSGRLWRMNYRFLGPQKPLSHGTYPEVSLAKAREKKIAAREALPDGLDRTEVRRARGREAKAKSEETLKTIADEWLVRLEIEGRAPNTLQKMRWLLDLACRLMATASSQTSLHPNIGSSPHGRGARALCDSKPPSQHFRHDPSLSDRNQARAAECNR